MKKKIFYIVESPFSERDYHRYGIDFFIENKYSIEVWDFSAYLMPLIHKKFIYKEDFNKVLRVFKFRDEIEKNLNIIDKGCVLICLISNSQKSRFIFDILENNNLNYGISKVNTIPVALNRLSLFDRFYRLAKNPTKILKKIKAFLFSKSFKPTPNFIFVGGEASLIYAKNSCIIEKKTKIIKTHSRDYDIFLDSKNLNEYSNESFVLFLDEYSPYHPDSIFSGNEPDCHPDSYYSEINDFFDFLENKIKMKVLIAAHPRSEYDKIGNPYGSRKIYNNKTNELVKSAKSIFCHASTAINFAILYSKPLNFITSNNYSSFYQHSISTTSNLLNKKPINISENFKNISHNFFMYDKIAYKRYFNQFIKMESSPDLNQWNIFLNFLNKN